MAEQDDKDKVYSDGIYINGAVDCADTNSDMHEALFLSHSLCIISFVFTYVCPTSIPSFIIETFRKCGLSLPRETPPTEASGFFTSKPSAWDKRLDISANWICRSR